jgi:hypothetical protein
MDDKYQDIRDSVVIVGGSSEVQDATEVEDELVRELLGDPAETVSVKPREEE